MTNTDLHKYTEEQQQKLANTIQKKSGISLLVGIKELGKAISGESKPHKKKSHANHQISAEEDLYEKKYAKKRAPEKIAT